MVVPAVWLHLRPVPPHSWLVAMSLPSRATILQRHLRENARRAVYRCRRTRCNSSPGRNPASTKNTGAFCSAACLGSKKGLGACPDRGGAAPLSGLPGRHGWDRNRPAMHARH